uniref:Calponin n=1 Tax=Nannospalax galili TaxID=1026970 RepID=A0A8C6RWD4_NANGA
VSSTQFNKGLSYRLSAEVKNWLLSEYDPQKESELCCWIERLTGQKGSVPKINRSQQNWHQPENLSNFIKAMVSYGMNPVYLFEANDLPKSRNKTHMQVSLLALAGKMGANKCTSQSGMMAYGTRRHLYDPKNHILPSMDHCTISLQMGINECASQVGTCRHIYDTKLGTDKCDSAFLSLQTGYSQGANQSGQVFGLGWQIYDPKYCPQGPAADAPSGTPKFPIYYQEEAGY